MRLDIEIEAKKFASQYVESILKHDSDLITISLIGNGAARGYYEGRLWAGDEKDSLAVAIDRGEQYAKDITGIQKDRSSLSSAYVTGFQGAQFVKRCAQENKN